MNPQEPHIDPEVEELLTAISTHSKNTRRQADLMEMVDQLAKEESAPKKRILWPYWMGLAAAACVALVLMVRPHDGTQMAQELLPDVSERTIIAESAEPIVSDSLPVDIPVHHKPAVIRQDALTEADPIMNIEEHESVVLEPSVDELHTVAEDELLAVADETPMKKVIDLKGYACRGKSNNHRPEEKPETNLFGKPIHEEQPILAFAF